MPATNDNLELLSHEFDAHSATGTRTQVARVRAEYPTQLDYSGSVQRDSARKLDLEEHCAAPRGDPSTELGWVIHPYV